jgi:hypothetical protein
VNYRVSVSDRQDRWRSTLAFELTLWRKTLVDSSSKTPFSRGRERVPVNPRIVRGRRKCRYGHVLKKGTKAATRLLVTPWLCA